MHFNWQHIKGCYYVIMGIRFNEQAGHIQQKRPEEVEGQPTGVKPEP